MAKALIIYEDADRYKEVCKRIQKILSERQMDITLLHLGYEEMTQEQVKIIMDKELNYIFTMDMAGFQKDTLLGVSVYNIISPKQMHIVIDECVMKKFGYKEMPLNLYLFLPIGEMAWNELYPHIPNIMEYETLEMNEDGVPINSERNEFVLKKMICDFFRDVEGN